MKNFEKPYLNFPSTMDTADVYIDGDKSLHTFFSSYVFLFCFSNSQRVAEGPEPRNYDYFKYHNMSEVRQPLSTGKKLLVSNI